MRFTFFQILKMLRPYHVIIVGLFYCYTTNAEINENKLLHPIKTEEGANEILGDKADDKRSRGFFRIGKKSAVENEANDKKIDSKTVKEEDNYIPEKIQLIRVVNSESETPIYVPVEFDPESSDDTADEDEKRASGFFRIGKSAENVDKRKGFFRIGKSVDQNPMNKKASGFFRIGRTPIDKRGKGFFRIGKSLNEMDEKRASGFFRIGKSALNDKRSRGFFRIGRSKGFFRIGKAFPLDGEKRASGFFRIDRNSPEEMRKKASKFFRIGKSVNSKEENDKRASGFFRIGKKCSGDSDKAGDNLTEDKSQSNPENEDTSESFNQNSDEPVRRASQFFRIGKSSSNKVTKRSSGVNSSPEQNLNLNKRAFFRIGKVPTSAFMRIGRQHLLQSLVSDPLYRNGRIQQSSFIRIGKRSMSDNHLIDDEQSDSSM